MRSVGLRVLVVCLAVAAVVAALPAAGSAISFAPGAFGASSAAVREPASKAKPKVVCRVVRARVRGRVVRRKVCVPARPKPKLVCHVVRKVVRVHGHRRVVRRRVCAPVKPKPKPVPPPLPKPIPAPVPPGGPGTGGTGGGTSTGTGGGTTTGTVTGGGTGTGSGTGTGTSTGTGTGTGAGDGTERVDLISNGGFEGTDNPVGCFTASYGTVDVSAVAPIPGDGAQSLHMTISPYGHVDCTNGYGDQGPIGKAVTVEGDVRVNAPTDGSADLLVCAIVYYLNVQDPVQTCQTVHANGGGVVHVSATQDTTDADNPQGKRLASVTFELQDQPTTSGGATIDATLDDAHLWVDQIPGSAGTGGGGGGGSGGGGGGGGQGNPGALGAPEGRYAAMVSPTDGETFTDDALSLRLIGIGHDPNVETNTPVGGRGMNAASVQFYIDGQPVGAPVDGSVADYHVFQTYVNSLNLAPGAHQVWQVATYVNPAATIECPHVTINVVDPPAYAQTVNLTSDVTIGPGESFSLVGSPTGRIRLNGNGHRIITTDANGTTGQLTLEDVDVYDLGSNADRTSPAIDFAASGSGGVTIEDSTFDSSTSVDLHLNGSSTATIRGNLFRSNSRVPVGQEPDTNAGDPPDGTVTYPSVSIDGTSTVPKTFAGNDVGAAPVHFEHADHWTIGGTTDADSNVFIGPRAAVELVQSSNFLIEGNFINHVYYDGWSQGQLLELGDSAPIAVKHNVLMDSSWPVRGINGEFAYNLVTEGGHELMVPGGDGSSAYIHHNIFIGGNDDQGGITGYYNVDDRIENNTFDGLTSPTAASAIQWQDGHTTLKSNAFLGWPTWTNATIDVRGGTLDAGYNGFFDDQLTNYLGMTAPTTDLNGGASTDPLFTGPLPTTNFDMDKVAVWQRTLPVSAILAHYRDRYTPKAGSPYIDAGDPAGGAGNDVGAVGAGTPNALDKFGTFGQG